MEPTSSTITRYIIYTYIDEVFLQDDQHYVHLRGSRESIWAGTPRGCTVRPNSATG